MDLLFTGSAFFLVAITFIPLIPSNHWSVRGWEFPRLQIAALQMICLGYLFLFEPAFTYERQILIPLLTLSLIYQLIWILPYTRIFPKEVKKIAQVDNSKTISILNSNVLMTNRDAEKLLAQIAKHSPDLVVTLETDMWWQEQLASIETDYPFSVKKPLDNLYGMHLYSRLPLSQTVIKELVEEGVPSIHCNIKLKSGDIIECHFLHPAPPSPTENAESTERDQELLMVAKDLQNNSLPTIVTGDLNDVAWSPTTRKFREVSRLNDPRIGRGMFNTFHADHKIARWPLDHIFHSEHFSLIEIIRLESIGSDHFPLYTKLQLN